MYTPRKLNTPGQRRDSNYPMYTSSPPSTPLSSARQQRRRLGIPFVRSRIHPLFLIPVFLFGAYFSPFKGPAELVYTGPGYREDGRYGGVGETFLPPDAPPLSPEEEEGERLGGRRKKVVAVAAQVQEEEDEGEFWDFNSQPSDDGDGSSSSTTPHLIERDGYLYYPTSVPLVDIVIPKAKRPLANPIPPRAPLGAGLTKPPPPPAWHHPGAHILPRTPPIARPARAAAPALNAPLPLAPPPGRAAAGAAAGKGRPGARLPAFLQAGGVRAPGARPNPPPAPAPPAAAKPRAQPHKVAIVPERGPQGQILGPNAAAMAKAAREGIPFRPKRPWDLEEERKEAERKKEREERVKDAAREWEPVKAEGRFRVAPPAFEGDVKEEEEEEEEEVGGEANPWMKVMEDDDEDEESSALDEDEDEDDEDAGDEDDEEGGHDDAAADAAVLQALLELTPEQRKYLSKEELALVTEIEKEQIEAEKAVARVAERVAKPAPALVVDDLVEDDDDDDDEPKMKPRLPVFRGKPKAPAPKVKGGRQRVAPAKKKKTEKRMALRKRAVVEEEPAQEGSTSAVSEDDARPPPPMLVARDNSASSPPRSKDRLHPIAKLIADAEEQWEDMLRRQSQTLEHAVFEYQRRYGRKPPLGFDKWWRYAMENRVILVDEYDQIASDIEPFFALSATEVRARATALATDRQLPHFAQSFSITVKDGSLKASGPKAKVPKSEDMQDMMSAFAEVLPDMTLTFASHGEPSVVVSGEARARHVKAAREGKVLDSTESYEVLENPGYTPFQGLCSPNSTARRLADGRPLDRVPSGPSFVSLDHPPAMDMCTHPEIQHQNGFTAWEGPRPYLLYPLFSWSKTQMHGDLLCAPLDDYFAEVGHDPTWEGKKHNKVLWRGASNGVYHDRTSGWRSTHRARLVHLANDIEGTREVRFADPTASDSLRRFIGPTRDINEHYFDIAYANAPVQCSVEDETCEVMKREMRFVPTMSKDEGNQYKYVMDVDGNGWSDRFHRLMSSRSLVFKSTIFPEWWTQRVMPWFHYVPIKSDYSDLTDAAAFFIGAPDGTGAHDAMAKKIAANGKKWAAEHWREVDMAAYQFRLYLEYSRLINRDDKGTYDFTLN